MVVYDDDVFGQCQALLRSGHQVPAQGFHLRMIAIDDGCLWWWWCFLIMMKIDDNDIRILWEASSFGQTEVVKTSIPSSQVSNLNIPVAGGKYQAKVHHKTKKNTLNLNISPGPSISSSRLHWVKALPSCHQCLRRTQLSAGKIWIEVKLNLYSPQWLVLTCPCVGCNAK